MDGEAAEHMMTSWHENTFRMTDPLLRESAGASNAQLRVFVVINFDVLAQASDFRIERRQVVFLCWMQDSNQGLWNRISSRLNTRWQTNWATEVF